MTQVHSRAAYKSYTKTRNRMSKRGADVPWLVFLMAILIDYPRTYWKKITDDVIYFIDEDDRVTPKKGYTKRIMWLDGEYRDNTIYLQLARSLKEIQTELLAPSPPSSERDSPSGEMDSRHYSVLVGGVPEVGVRAAQGAYTTGVSRSSSRGRNRTVSKTVSLIQGEFRSSVFR